MNKHVMVHSFLYFVENGFLMPQNSEKNILVSKSVANVDEQKIHNFLWQFQGPDQHEVYKNTLADICPEDMDKKVSDGEAFTMVWAILSKVMEKQYDPTLTGGTHMDPYTTTIGEAVRLYARTRWIGDDRIAENLVRQALRHIDVGIIQHIHGHACA